ncbi:hypothetical protein PWT90_10644 [Aphanocladium album]|nr:hypothetical protein PWT90_10644 [Aphanocladium album]
MKFTILAAATMASVASAGHATYYEPNGHAGNCGWGIDTNSWAVALPSHAYRSDLCGKGINVRHNGKTLRGYIADSCPTCAPGDIDLARGLFTQFADTSVGVIDVDWWY